MRLWRRRKDDIDEEIATHLAMAAADREERGESSEEARRRQSASSAIFCWFARQHKACGDGSGSIESCRTFDMPGGRCVGPWILADRHCNSGVGIGRDGSHVYSRQSRSASGSTLFFATAAGFSSGVRPKGRPRKAPWPDIEQWQLKARSFEEIGFYIPATGRPFLEGEGAAEQIGHLSRQHKHVLHARGETADRARLRRSKGQAICAGRGREHSSAE